MKELFRVSRSRGIYVELPNTVEGLVHVTNMTDDHYDYDEEHYQMIGSHHRKTYKLGQKVRVKMIDCDEISRTIDFRLVKEKKREEREKMAKAKSAGQDDCEQ